MIQIEDIINTFIILGIYTAGLATGWYARKWFAKYG